MMMIRRMSTTRKRVDNNLAGNVSVSELCFSSHLSMWTILILTVTMLPGSVTASSEGIG